MNTVVVTTPHRSLWPLAQQLATKLELPLLRYEEIQAAGQHRLMLVYVEHDLEQYRLTLQRTDQSKESFFVDFVNGALGYRRKHGGGKQQPLARAIGLPRCPNLTVFDATAGTGRDALVLAALGCRVIMVEKNPIVAALLQDAMRRACLNENVNAIVRDNLSLYCGDSKIWLAKLAKERVIDVVYLDPMYPERKKSALVKKDMRLLRELVGDDQDARELLQLAIHTAVKHVVVKRPKSAATISDIVPHHSVENQTTRFDVYTSLR